MEGFLVEDDKFILNFDIFFKKDCHQFFPLRDYDVSTDEAIFHLPKRADVLVLESRHEGPPPDFKIFDYWKACNLISFKSLAQQVCLQDIDDTVIYLLGYLGMSSAKGTHSDTTITLVYSKPPTRPFLKELRSRSEKLAPGKYRIDSNWFTIHVVDLNEISLDSWDACFLLNHAPTERLEEVADRLIKEKHARKDQKVIDKLLQSFSNRVQWFEKQEFKEQIMPARLEVDITHVVQPYYEKWHQEGRQEGRSVEQLKNAERMLAKGYSLKEVMEITGLKKKGLIEAGLLK